MIKALHLYPLDRCCMAWYDSVRRDLIRLTLDGFCLIDSDLPIRICPYCGDSKQGRSMTPVTLAR